MQIESLPYIPGARPIFLQIFMGTSSFYDPGLGCESLEATKCDQSKTLGDE